MKITNKTQLKKTMYEKGELYLVENNFKIKVVVDEFIQGQYTISFDGGYGIPLDAINVNKLNLIFIKD